MTDFIDNLLKLAKIEGSNAKALKFVTGVGIIVYSIAIYTTQNQILPAIGLLFGGYLILVSIE